MPLNHVILLIILDSVTDWGFLMKIMFMLISNHGYLAAII